jgi:carbon storage regulator
MLILSRKIDEKIQIGDNITLTIIDIHGEQVKIGVEAPKNIKVFRQEVFEAIQKENKAAAVEQNNNEAGINAVSALSKLIKK